MKYTWERRIERAEQLAQSVAHARQILAFYAEVLKWQRETFTHLASASSPQPLTGSFEVDHPLLLDHFASLLALAKRQGSAALAAQAEELAADRDDWKDLVAAYWHGDLAPEESFFARVCLQPYLELLANTNTPPFDSNLTAFAAAQIGGLVQAQPHRLCPFCGRKPQLALLSNETDLPGMVAGSAEGGRRFLMCGDCLTLWPYQRIACVNCQEADPYKLPYYSAEDIPHMRVECCDSCRHYLKSIDLTKDGRPVPPVDELAALPLDLWAHEQGYLKIQPNLAGI